MKFTVRILDKSFTNPLTLPDVVLKPKRYSFAAIGGPKDAEISVDGDERALWEMLEWLRCPIEIIDERQTAVWWGYIHGVEISVGAFRAGVSLDEMYNRVAVAYSYVAPGSTSVGNRATTAWAQDDDSVAYYGTKEILSSMSSGMTEQADGMRDAILTEKFKPGVTLNFGQMGKATNSGRLICKGWWETLGWRYYAQLAGKESYEDLGSGVQDLGRTSSNQKVAQKFQFAGTAGWDLASVKVKMKKYGTPADTVIAEIWSDTSGSPGSMLNTNSISAALISTSTGWIEISMPSLIGGGFLALAPLTDYWLVISRSGAVNNTNYYQVDGNEALGYANGVFRVSNGTTWSARTPDMDMNFQILGGRETTLQIQDLVSANGQFLSGTYIVNRSNLINNQYRLGEKTALNEAEDLLKAGVNGGRRLLARVTQQREVVLEQEPAASRDMTQIYVKRDGSIETIWGDVFMAQTCPVGVWAVLKDVVPSSLDLGRLADPSLFFIEESAFDVDQGRYIPTPRGQRTVWDIATRIVEG